MEDRYHNVPAPPQRASAGSLPIVNVDTFETNAAFLSPTAVIAYLEDIIRTVESVQKEFQGRSVAILGDRMADDIHGLAGKVGMFGFVRLNEVAREVERTSRTGRTIEPELGAELDDALEATLSQARHRLEAAIATSRAASCETRGTETVENG